MRVQKNLMILAISSIFIAGCATNDIELARYQQCNSFRHEMWKIEHDPQTLKHVGANRHYKDMRLEYGSLGCKDLKDYFAKSN
jgi:hypothetical protein